LVQADIAKPLPSPPPIYTHTHHRLLRRRWRWSSTNTSPSIPLSRLRQRQRAMPRQRQRAKEKAKSNTKEKATTKRQQQQCQQPIIKQTWSTSASSIRISSGELVGESSGLSNRVTTRPAGNRCKNVGGGHSRILMRWTHSACHDHPAATR